MLTSVFSKEQDDYIKSYMADFEATTSKLDPELQNKSTRQYRQEKANEIIDSELFTQWDDKGDLKKASSSNSQCNLTTDIHLADYEEILEPLPGDEAQTGCQWN
jgi:hypothetical protein